MNSRLKLSIIRNFDALPTSRMTALTEDEKEHRKQLGLSAFFHRTDKEKAEVRELNKEFHKQFKLNDPRA
jgi:2-oxo-4-hydroxy-4-carboxy--5-ureidoimidazoline (OHCU) decarboxylase